MTTSVGPLVESAAGRGERGTVFVVDDSSDSRESLSMLVHSAGLTSRTYASAEEFLANYSSELSGCLVLDVRMPGISGMELQQRLVALKSDLPVIMVTGYGEIPLAVQAIQEGALDFLCKPYSQQAILDRIQQALHQNAHQRAQRQAKIQTEARLATLSQRERQVAELLAEGNSTKEVARILEISPKTVDNHRSKVMNKLQVDNSIELRKLLVL